MKILLLLSTLAIVCLTGCDDSDVSGQLDNEQLAYALGGQKYLIEIPDSFDKDRELLGFSLEFGDQTRQSLGGIGDLAAGGEVVGICLPEGKHSWLFSVFGEGFQGRLPIGLPAEYQPHVVSVFTNPSSRLSIGDMIVEFQSDKRAANGSFPRGDTMKIMLTVLPKNQPSEQAGAGQPATAPESKPEGGENPKPESEPAPR